MPNNFSLSKKVLSKGKNKSKKKMLKEYKKLESEILRRRIVK